MPDQPEIGPPWSTISNPKAIASAFRNATIFASDDEHRPVLCCVQMAANADTLTIVASDSYLLLVQELIVAREPRLGHETGVGEWHALVHRDSLRLMLALLQGVKDVPVDLECSHPGGEGDEDIETLTVQIGDGRAVPAKLFGELAAQLAHNRDDPLVCAAAHLVVAREVGAASMLQRKLHVSFDRANWLIGELERQGVVGPAGDGDRARPVLMSAEQLDLAGFGPAPNLDEPDDGTDPDEQQPAKAGPQLVNAGDLTMRVGESELILPLYDEGVYPDYEKILDRDVGEIDGATFTASIIKRLGSLQLPSGASPLLDWTFCGDNAPVLFKAATFDDDLAMHGAFMPARSA